jgi:HNH endonuclease
VNAFCSGTTRAGDPCRRKAITGREQCYWHGPRPAGDGSPIARLAAARALLLEKMPLAPDGHRRWAGNKDQWGYPLSWRGTRVRRLIWETFRGPIPAGMIVTNDPGACTVRECVEPSHLRLVARRDRIREYNSRPAEERFWEKVEKLPGGCWRWKAGARPCSPEGLFYPSAGSCITARRAAWLFTGGELAAGEVLLPKCGGLDGLCINPEHQEKRPKGTRAVDLRGGRGRGKR